MSYPYSITFINNSNQAGTACLYQQDSGHYGPGAMSLAWMARPAYPNMSVVFSWTIDYSFFWAETGALKPGVQVNPGQTIPADPRDSNSIVLTSPAPYNFRFDSPQQRSQQGTFYVTGDASIPPNTVTFGIGMSGAGTFGVQAQPNYTNVFTPHPSYWLTFGNYQQGQVLDVDSMVEAVRVEFPGNVYDMRVTLNPDNTFTVQQGR